jgi:hypothetical protein
VGQHTCTVSVMEAAVEVVLVAAVYPRKTLESAHTVDTGRTLSAVYSVPGLSQEHLTHHMDTSQASNTPCTLDRNLMGNNLL